MTPYQILHERLVKASSEKDRKGLTRFFKTGPGEYGEGDVFLGVRVPVIRKICRDYTHLSLKQLTPLLSSKFHEERLAALILLVTQFQKADDKEQEKIALYYLHHLEYVNNWDLVDTSAEKILGAYLFDKDTALLFELADSGSLWERRVAILSSFYFLKQGKSKLTYQLSKKLLEDPHDLIHKAVGWMLREAGKRVSTSELETFLKQHKSKIARTTLHYAIEKFPPSKRLKFLA